ncbi:hypothetical protein Cgig2_021320 [Carnegiea gigantea]|uniref:Uncharacterized protein n=1 Tax=Carnegiea gigantea TaxID=171969 RepID=A0A9Q1JK90_9CARY|nr:hypothetical protein Cgig2_021320 [Carnegiea gigantea]
MDDMALFTGLLAIRKIVEFAKNDMSMIKLAKIAEFAKNDMSMTKLAKMVRLHMPQYATEKSDKLKREKESKKPVFRSYIKIMKKLLDANKEPDKLGLWLILYSWIVMSGAMFLRTPYGAVWFYEHTTRFPKHDNERFPRLANNSCATSLSEEDDGSHSNGLYEEIWVLILPA